MDWYQIENNWDYAKLHIRQHWEKLKDQELDFNLSHRQHLIQKISETYKIGLYEAERQLSDWQESLINIDGYFYSSKH
jgi:hypothetical protein